MTPEEIDEALLKIESYIENEEWSYAIEWLAKLAVFCNQMWRKAES
jgi:hypothetical protein